MRHRAELVLAAVLAASVCAAAEHGAPDGRFCPYGTYSLGTKYASSFRDRAAELRSLGGDFVVGMKTTRGQLDDLPPGILAAPGCSLLKKSQWRDEQAARRRLGELAADFATHPRVWGVCIGHEVDEFADHQQRARMYRLAKPFFPGKHVFFYYAHVPSDYGIGGEIESDVFFTALNPFDKQGNFDLAKATHKLDAALAAVDRTPGIPVWGQTSINADHGYVSGPETRSRTWGANGENMVAEAHELFARRSPAGARLAGFFWRSLGRFDWDRGYPAFAAQRQRVREVARHWDRSP